MRVVFVSSIAVGEGGTFVITWVDWGRDGDESGVFGRAFAADGSPLSDDFQINTTDAGSQNRAAIAAAPQGSMVAVWLTFGGDVFARLLAPEL